MWEPILAILWQNQSDIHKAAILLSCPATLCRRVASSLCLEPSSSMPSPSINDRRRSLFHHRHDRSRAFTTGRSLGRRQYSIHQLSIGTNSASVITVTSNRPKSKKILKSIRKAENSNRYRSSLITSSSVAARILCRKFRPGATHISNPHLGLPRFARPIRGAALGQDPRFAALASVIRAVARGPFGRPPGPSGRRPGLDTGRPLRQFRL
jgi:hypothetical protein